MVDSVIVIKKRMDTAKKQRSVNWTEREKVLLVQSVLEREDELFGRNKGGSREVITRHKSWTDLQDALNAELDIPRTVEQMKKAFENIKSRAKLKVEQIRDVNGSVSYHYVSTTPSIQLVIDRLCGMSPKQPPDNTSNEVTNDNGYTSNDITTCNGNVPDLKPRIYSFGSVGSEEEEESMIRFTDQGSGEPSEGPIITEIPQEETEHAHSNKRKCLEEELLEYRVKKTKAEIEKLAAETQLINNRQHQERELYESRKRQEAEIFELKKQLINAKIENLSEIGDLT